MTEPIIRTVDLCKDFGEIRVLRGISVDWTALWLHVLIGMTVVILSEIVGIVLVLALLVLPAATAALFAKRLGTVMLIAVILSFLYTVGGLAISYSPGLPVGATIIELAGAAYLLTAAIRKLILHRNQP